MRIPAKEITLASLGIVLLTVAGIPAYANDSSVSGSGTGTIFDITCPGIGSVSASITFDATRAKGETTGTYTITASSITITGTITGEKIQDSHFTLKGVVSGPSCEGPLTGVEIAGGCGTGVTITYVELFGFGTTGTFTGTVTCLHHS